MGEDRACLEASGDVHREEVWENTLEVVALAQVVQDVVPDQDPRQF